MTLNLRLLVAVALLGATGPRYYWPTSVSTLAHGLARHTHVEVTGVAIRTRMEDDGDQHVWLREPVGRDSVLAECIPALPCGRVPLGSLIRVRGISRYDPEHKWWEVHPVEQIIP